MDVTLEAKVRAEILLEELSLEEKMAQVCGVLLWPGMEDKIKETCPNGIGEVSGLVAPIFEKKEDLADWQRNLQVGIMQESPHHIPAIFHMEGICGGLAAESLSFPSEINRAATFDVELERNIGTIVARQEAAYGATHIFAPVIDISRDSRFGRQAESYGEDPTLTAALGVAYTKGIQEVQIGGRNAEAVGKHFLGYHSCQGGINATNVEIGDRQLEEVYGKPFQAAITEANIRGIMPCYCSVNGLPTHGAKNLLTQLLRKNMGFDGVIVSDYGAVRNSYENQKVNGSTTEAGVHCMNAGVDIELPQSVCFNDKLKELFEKKKIDIQILNRAVYRILEAKFRMGLFEHPFALTGSELEETIYHSTDDEISKKAAQESLILLKNNGILPLSNKEKTIAVIGPQAGNARFYFGGYTRLSMVEGQLATKNAMAGVEIDEKVPTREIKQVPGTDIQEDDAEEFDDILKKMHPNCKSLLEELTNQMPETKFLYAKGYHKSGSDQSLFKEALQEIEKADLVILTLGGKCGSGSIATMGEGIDGTNINIPACQEQFIYEAKKLNKPMVGIHFDGRPISSDAAQECLDAIIEAFTPAEFTANAVANVLIGTYNPSGKLPLCVPYNAGQIPVYYNHPNGTAWNRGENVGFQSYVDCPHTPRYYFGYGLSYTTFSYSDIKISRKEVTPNKNVVISLNVMNTGNTTGTEVVQLYLKDVNASMIRPVMELAGFARIELHSKESKTVTFIVNPSQMAFLDEDMRWKIEKGEIKVAVGSSSNELLLEDSFFIIEDLWIQGRNRKFYADVTFGVTE